MRTSYFRYRAQKVSDKNNNEEITIIVTTTATISWSQIQ